MLRDASLLSMRTQFIFEGWGRLEGWSAYCSAWREPYRTSQHLLKTEAPIDHRHDFDHRHDRGRAASLRVLLVDPDPARAEILKAGLAGSEAEIVAVATQADDLARCVQATVPDVIIVGLESPGPDTFERLRAVTRAQPRPIVMFVDSSGDGMIEEAIRAGVSAYVIDGLNEKRVRPVLDVAIARFREDQALRQELEKTKTTLSERKLIERAKGLLMAEKQISEDEAYRALRRLAMDQNKRLVDVAQALITYAQVLKAKS